MDDFGSCVIVVHLFDFLGVWCPAGGKNQREDTNFDPFEQDSFLAIHDVDVSRSELVQKSDTVVSVLAKRETENISPSHFDQQQTPQRTTTTTMVVQTNVYRVNQDDTQERMDVHESREPCPGVEEKSRCNAKNASVQSEFNGASDELAQMLKRRRSISPDQDDERQAASDAKRETTNAKLQATSAVMNTKKETTNAKLQATSAVMNTKKETTNAKLLVTSAVMDTKKETILRDYPMTRWTCTLIYQRRPMAMTLFITQVMPILRGLPMYSPSFRNICLHHRLMTRPVFQLLIER